jgi:putative peptidoglycan lipid II flippase
MPPSAPGAVTVIQPPETVPSGIDLSELPRETVPRSYPSRRSLREAAAASAGGPTTGTTSGPASGPTGATLGPTSGTTAVEVRAATDSAATDDGTSTLMRSSAVMAAGTFVSRVLGMARAVVIAWAIGQVLSADAFQTANSLPNNLYILIAGGALNAVLVPQISRAMRQGEAGRVYVDRLLSMSILLLGVTTVLVTLAAPLLVSLYGNDLGPQAYALCVAMAYWCIPQVFFYGLYTLLGQVLNARGSFGPYMWAPVVNNVVAIGGMLCFVAVAGGAHPARPGRPAGDWTSGQIALFAGTATLGVVAQALVLIPVLRRSGFGFRFRWGLRGVGLGRASTVAAWTFAAVLVAQVGYVVASRTVTAAGSQEALGRQLGAGRAVYDNAYLIFVLPHSLVAVSIVTAVFTRMSRAAAEGRTDDVRSDLSLALRTVGVATVLATAAFVVLARDLAFALFGATGRAQTDVIGWAVTAMATGLVAYSVQYLAQRVFYAYEDARTPFRIQVVVTVVWVVGLLAASAAFDGRRVVFAAGAALAVSLTVGAGLSLTLVRRRLGGMDGARVLRTHVRLGVSALLAAIAGWSTRVALTAWLGPGHAVVPATILGTAAVMVAVYVALLKVLQVRELDDLLLPVTARLRRG